MSCEAFWYLHDIIAGDPVFILTGHWPHHPVRIQLVMFLIKYGAVSGVKTAGVVPITKGTVHLYCHCVCHAIWNVCGKHLSWPGDRTWAYLKDEMAKWGFPGCIGIVDGTLIPLIDKPLRNGWAYFCRKKFYAVRMHFWLLYPLLMNNSTHGASHLWSLGYFLGVWAWLARLSCWCDSVQAVWGVGAKG